MKKVITLLSLILAMFFLVSCASDDEEDTTDSDSASGKTCESSADCPVNYTCDTDKKVCTKNPSDTGDTTPSDPTDTGDTTPSDPTDTGDTAPSDPSDTGDADTTPSDPSDTGDTAPAPAPECEISNSFKASAYKDGEHYLFYGSGIVSDGDHSNSPTVTKEGTFTSLYTEEISDYDPSRTQSFIVNATLGSGAKAISVNTLIYDDTNHVAFNLTANMKTDYFSMMDAETRTASFAPEVEILSVKSYSDGGQKLCTVAYSVMNAPANEGEPELAEGKFQYCNGDDGTMNIGQTVKIGIDAKLTSSFEAIQAYFNEGLDESDPYFVKTTEDLCWCIPQGKCVE